jgi:hypothetical protein
MTQSNLGKYKSQLEELLLRGLGLELAMQLECHPDEFKRVYAEKLRDKFGEFGEFVKKLPNVSRDYTTHCMIDTFPA